MATAYFSICGFQQVRETLPGVTGFRLLLGDEPHEGGDVGLHPQKPPTGLLREEFNAAALSEETQLLVKELIRFLHRETCRYGSI